MNKTAKALTPIQRAYPDPRTPEARAVRLGKMGIEHAAIAKKTNMTVHKVKYRLKKFGVSIRAWRKLESREAKFVINAMEDYIQQQVDAECRRQKLIT